MILQPTNINETLTQYNIKGKLKLNSKIGAVNCHLK